MAKDSPRSTETTGVKKLIKRSTPTKRAELRAKILKDPNASIEEKLEAQAEASPSCRATPARRASTDRCEVSGRSKAYYRKFGISRIALRELAPARPAPRRAQEQLVEASPPMKPEIHPTITR